METRPLLLGVGEVEACTGLDVVDVPASVAVVLPGHALLELGLKVGSKLIHGTAEKLQSSSRLSSPPQGVTNTHTNIHLQSEKMVILTALTSISCLFC